MSLTNLIFFGDTLENICDTLFEKHYSNTLKCYIFLFSRFLNLVSKNSEMNRMTASNLSIVLAPNLLWNSEATLNGADTCSLSVQ